MTMTLCSVDWNIRTSSLLWFSSSPPANRAKSIPNTFSMSAGLFQHPGVNDSNTLPTAILLFSDETDHIEIQNFEISMATGPPSQEAQSLSSPFRTTGGGSKGAGLAQWGPCLHQGTWGTLSGAHPVHAESSTDAPAAWGCLEPI